MQYPTATARMSDFPELPPSWPAWAGGLVVLLGYGLKTIREYMSSSNVDRAADTANAATIERLQSAYLNERDRSDTLMRENIGFIREIGELKSQVGLLTEQVKHLTQTVKLLHAQPMIAAEEVDGNNTQGAG